MNSNDEKTTYKLVEFRGRMEHVESFQVDYWIIDAHLVTDAGVKEIIFLKNIHSHKMRKENQELT